MTDWCADVAEAFGCGPEVAARPVYEGQNPLVMELGGNIGARDQNRIKLCEILGPGQ